MPEDPSATSTPPPAPDEHRQGTPSSQLGSSADDHPSAGDRPSTLLDRDPTLGYSTFDISEVAIVLSHYDLGVVHAVREFRRGSRHSPKLLIKSEKGAFILKRRAHGRDDPVKVAFCHNLQRTLARARYPLPRLALTRSGVSMLNIGGRMYELFEYISGQVYDHSLHATFEAGQALALFHLVLSGETPEWEPPGSGYHRSPHIIPNLAYIPHRLRDDSLLGLIDSLRESYMRAGERVEAAGLAEWPRQIIHGDWHPGNMLFKESRIVAVIDYDTARVQPRVLDIANGMLQFSITRAGEDPLTWPAEPDEGRLKRFCRGYDSKADPMISKAELQTLPDLMIEAVIAEAAVPIAATGRFGRMEAGSFLRMVERKVRWLHAHSDKIARLVS